MFNSHIKSVTLLTLYFPKVIFKSVTLLTLYFLTNNIYIYYQQYIYIYINITIRQPVCSGGAGVGRISAEETSGCDAQ